MLRQLLSQDVYTAAPMAQPQKGQVPSVVKPVNGYLTYPGVRWLAMSRAWVPSRNPSSQNYYRTSDFTGKPYREGWVLTGSHFLLLSKRSVSRFGSYHRLSTLMVISQLNITQTDCLLCPVGICGPKKPTKYLSYWLVPWWPTLCRKPVRHLERRYSVAEYMWDLQECEVEAPAH